MKVRDFMTVNVQTMNEDQTVGEAASLMFEKGFSIVPIVDNENHLRGVITESDFVGKEVNIPHALVSLKQLFGKNYHLNDIESVYKQARGTKLSKVMSKKVKTISKDASLSSVVDQMVVNHLKRLPVVEEGRIIGIITRKDLLKAFNTIK